jgi:FMN phosphatase YigB (HAD superfamily)
MRSTGLLVSLLSDMFLFEAIKTKSWGRYDAVDYVSLSAEIGASKDSPEAFMHTLKHFNLPAGSVLFVDDKKSNIDTAHSIGIDCLWADKQEYSSAESLVRSIRDQLTGLKMKTSHAKERPLLT